jgi:hypothetical protein
MAMTLLTTNPDSTDVASVEFTSSIDSTYKLYVFKFFDVNPATDGADFTFNGSDDTSSWSYDITKTSTFFEGYHEEDDGSPSVLYKTDHDEAQSADPQVLAHDIGNAADDSCAGELFLFNPSNTTYVKHFYARVHESYITSSDPSSIDCFIGGYFNTTAAITAVQFKMDSGNMDAVISMYGVG